MFRPDKPLPPIPKGISDKFTSMMAKGPPPTLPNKPQQGRSQSPSKDTGFGASCVSQARAMFESSMKPSGSQQRYFNINDYINIITYLVDNLNNSKHPMHRWHCQWQNMYLLVLLLIWLKRFNYINIVYVYL